jgi:hypothetical protein
MLKRLFTITVLLAACMLQGSCTLFGKHGNSLDELRQAISDTVADPARAAAMLESLERSDQLMLRSAKLLADGAAAQIELFVDYDTTPAQFQALFEQVSNARRELQEALLREHIVFKNTATAGEWAVLVGIHTRAVNARSDALGRSAISAASS